jgi:hypothetical protein
VIVVTSSEGAQLFFILFRAFTYFFSVVPHSSNTPRHEGVIIWHPLFESVLRGEFRT